MDFFLFYTWDIKITAPPTISAPREFRGIFSKKLAHPKNFMILKILKELAAPIILGAKRPKI